ncbi:MAG: hypothetical protein VX033_01515, partial [Verrucomicrobiota bacterium]|nr:hypothetical protein [Verrucomicrobiota bacterium]
VPTDQPCGELLFGRAALGAALAGWRLRALDPAAVITLTEVDKLERFEFLLGKLHTDGYLTNHVVIKIGI